jgi:hypothetical protein
VNEPSREFEERLRRIRPGQVSAETRDAIGERLRPGRVGRDWPMLCAIGSSLAAACVIVAVLIQQTPTQATRSIPMPSVAAASSQEPPAMYAFSFRNDLFLNDARSVR